MERRNTNRTGDWNARSTMHSDCSRFLQYLIQNSLQRRLIVSSFAIEQTQRNERVWCFRHAVCKGVNQKQRLHTGTAAPAAIGAECQVNTISVQTLKISSYGFLICCLLNNPIQNNPDRDILRLCFHQCSSGHRFPYRRWDCLRNPRDYQVLLYRFQ